MYRIVKELSFAAGHFIRGHDGECAHPHGHNYRLRVHLASPVLDALGMVMDFAELKAMLEEIVAPFDHRMINDVPPFTERNTTAELLAEHVFREVERRVAGRVEVVRVEVWETESAGAVFEAGP